MSRLPYRGKENAFMNNFAELCGDVAAAPVFSHENHGCRFVSFPLRVLRLSGTADVPNVIVPEAVSGGIEIGRRIRLSGQLRSHNNHNPRPDGLPNRLLILMWARCWEPCDDAYENHIVLTGTVCREPVYRRTPYGREISDIMLRVERPGGLPGAPKRCDYLPCVTWGSVARMAAALPPHSRLSVSGRLQSRAYTKIIDGQCERRTAYEVSVSEAIAAV